MGHTGSGPQRSVQEIFNIGYNLGVSALVVSENYNYLNIVTSAQNAVKTTPGILGGIAINSTLVSAVRGYDNIVSGGNILFTIPAATTAGSIFYKARFTTGLVVSTGAAADNVTVLYN